MNKVEAIIQPSKLDEVKDALVRAGVSGMTISQVEGFGHQKGKKTSYRGTSYTADFVAKIKLETVVAEDMTNLVVDLIIRAAKTGSIGDGKIFVTPVSRVVRIRTGEVNEAALASHQSSLA